MTSKHGNDAIDLHKPYEENEIRLRGIIGFAIGLFLLIVITFGLMWALLYKLDQFNDESAVAGPQNPMAMSEKEKLPPEPRLQLAPGFGVEDEKARVNLELREPSAEYRELHKQWLELWEHGQKDPRTGTVTMLPIDEAKEKFLEEHVKAKTGPEAEDVLKRSHLYVTDASSGRMAGERRR
jgi:hypothetical protein